ncbi:uncharacterized protein LOC131995773 [Stomoxys calcitrans]|uniref:uncharacterized protein LOC106088835 n=1 Tax=Stomoxys calcitrans TaxID=35570 RepID=UPI0027E234C5|nr:uncharacterized protein LOC106088835 [Stomoxys calcitrans]XP_059220827.1 uncharacterized protein LOC131995773 [Stomoxys calcitrans]
MDSPCLKDCVVNDMKNSSISKSFESLPCQKKFILKPEDEISLDSIFSAVLDKVEPPEFQLQNQEWKLAATDMPTDKQALLFEDKMYISELQANGCTLNGETKILMERELKEVGEFNFLVEESYDGYVAFAKSNIAKGCGKYSRGHCVKGKYDDKLRLICEKRSEHDYVDKARIERTLDVRSKEDSLVGRRETKINNDVQRFKTFINIKGHDDIFLLDGGIMLLIRYLIVNRFRGNFNFYTMNLFGKILRCHLTVHEERKRIKMFHRTFTNAIRVVNIQYFNNYPQEVSETFYNSNGKMILHYWHGFHYILHETKGFIETNERIVPKMELMWRCQNELLGQYREKKKFTYDNAIAYFNKHAELCPFLMDFLLNVIKYKPQNVLEFTIKYFQKFRKPSLDK